MGSYAGGKLALDQVLVVGTGGGQKLAGNTAAIADFLRSGGNVLALGLDGAEANAFLPFKVTTKKAEHIAAYFEPAGQRLAAGRGGPGRRTQPCPARDAADIDRGRRASATACWRRPATLTWSFASSRPTA